MTTTNETPKTTLEDVCQAGLAYAEVRIRIEEAIARLEAATTVQREARFALDNALKASGRIHAALTDRAAKYAKGL